MEIAKKKHVKTHFPVFVVLIMFFFFFIHLGVLCKSVSPYVFFKLLLFKQVNRNWFEQDAVTPEHNFLIVT